MTAAQAAAVPAPLRAPLARLLELDLDRRARVWNAVRAYSEPNAFAELEETEKEVALDCLLGLIEAIGGEVPAGVRRRLP